MIRHCWRCANPLPEVPPTTCGVCGEVHYVNPKPCGCAVVLRDGAEVLLVLRARDPEANRWTIPGGFCDGDEHPLRAAERELFEEVGVRGHAIGYIGTWLDVYGPPAEDGLRITTAVSGYLAVLDDPCAAFTPDPQEAVEVRWWPLDDLPGRIAFPSHVPSMITVGAQLAARGTGPPLGELPDQPPTRDPSAT